MMHFAVLFLLVADPASDEALDYFIQGNFIESAQNPVSMEFGGGFLLPGSPELVGNAILRQFHRMAFGLQPDGIDQLSAYVGIVWDVLPDDTRNLWRELAGRVGLDASLESVTPDDLTSILRYCSETGTPPPIVETEDLTDLQRLYYVNSISQDRVEEFINDRCWAVRAAVIQRNPSSAFQMLDDPSETVRLAAAGAAGRADLLLNQSSTEGPIGHMALSGVGQIPILEDSLFRSNNPAIRSAALIALLELEWRIPDERQDYLLTDEYILVRAITADAAGREFSFPDEGVLPSDIPALEDVPDQIVISTEAGDFTMEMYKEQAPITCRSFWYLSRQGFYNGIYFHRVIPGFVAQAGCPEGNGFGGPGYTIPAENNTIAYTRGTVGMADAGMDTGGSQFFIMLDSHRRLDCRYTAFGRVLNADGIDRIETGTRILEIVAANP